MERKKNKPLKSASINISAYTLPEQIRIWILVILHVVGVVGFLLPQYKPLFVSITYLHLSIITLLLFFEKYLLTQKFAIFLVVSFLIGFGSEVFGVKSGLLFGYYHYTHELAFQVLDVPVVIGVLWAGLSYACNQIAAKFYKGSWWLNALTAALLMALFDYLIEPFAVREGLWVWHQAEIPLYNYICWFGIGFVISLFYQKLLYDTPENKVAPFYLLTQTLFFLILQMANQDWGFF